MLLMLNMEFSPAYSTKVYKYVIYKHSNAIKSLTQILFYLKFYVKYVKYFHYLRISRKIVEDRTLRISLPQLQRISTEQRKGKTNKLFVSKLYQVHALIYQIQYLQIV